MITPRFKLTQDDTFLIVTIHAPYSNIKDAEVEYDGKTFLFSSKPYFLRLYLPCEVECDYEQGDTAYESELGIFTIHVPKKNKGEYFCNLDMLSELIKPQYISADRAVFELPSTSNDIVSELENEAYIFEQKLAESDGDNTLESVYHLYGYGFACSRHGVLGKLCGEIGSLIEIIDPENSSIDSRSDYCREIDEEKFNAEYYLSDLFTPDTVQKGAMEFKFDDDVFQINDSDLEQLKDLPIHFLGKISNESHYNIALSLIDILFAYAYDLRTNAGEHTVESGWTIAKLSPTLCVLTRWQYARDALNAAVRRKFNMKYYLQIRRSLVYPICRNWELALKVVDDLEKILTGRSAILHCLLDIRTIFNTGGEFRYLLNQLYINDYCLWIQSVNESILNKLKTDFQEAKKKVDKFSMGLDLECIETEAKLKLMELQDHEKNVVDLLESGLENEDLNEKEEEQYDSDDQASTDT